MKSCDEMDPQYLDENEEFELNYQDELEMLNEMPDDNEDNVSIVNCGPVNRRLFTTPKTAGQRISSTPVNSQPFASFVSLDSAALTPIAECPPADPVVELQEMGLRSKRRLEQDLFGDIDDLYSNETYEDPAAKKARTEEERDLEAIAKILETRQRLREASKTVHKDSLSRLQARQAFKMQNLSYTVPQWPFLVVKCGDGDRIYVRFHSEDYETRALKDLRVATSGLSLLADNKEQLWQKASELVLKRTTNQHPQAVMEDNKRHVMREDKQSDQLWVEKYKPRKYIDLLSDEMTNRSLLYWLKMWDKVVFGKAFKMKSETANNSGLNTFNKRTGKFESNGGWRKRKTQHVLDTNVDEHGRPVQKVALLCGPPGLGKTTLAHTIARHAGYAVREVNASDDRSPEAFKLALENGTQMSSMLNEEQRPNCIILDEIDGAPRQSIEFLVKFVSDSAVNKTAKGKGKTERHVLKRPIICICNDVYDPVLRPLRQIAFIVTFPPIDAARLTERLMQIAHKERLKTDFGTLYTLAEKSGNDVRCCISTLQFFNAQKQTLTLHDVLNNNLGQKDRNQSLFDVWTAVFRIQRPRKQLQKSVLNDESQTQITMTNMSMSTRVQNVLDVVHSSSDYERLAQGVHENYLHQKMPDPNMTGVVEAAQWFCFNDELQLHINHLQNYTVYPYLQYAFVAWHLLFASLAWPKINFPTKGFEFRQKYNTQRNIFEALRKGIAPGLVGLGQGNVILVETVPLLKRILSPQFRSVAVQLLSAKERQDLEHVVKVMVDLGIVYTQMRSADGSYVFKMEPDLEQLSQYPGFPGITLSYFSRQIVARETELERIRRATPCISGETQKSARSTKKTKSVPNHLQRLHAKQIDKNANDAPAKDLVCKDFFGRMQRKTHTTHGEDSKLDAIVKSPIWYRYKEGFNNAVRKDVHMHELL